MSNDYKRKTRKVSEQTRRRISETLKGRELTPEHREHISEGLYNYWAKLLTTPGDGEET